MIVVPLEGRTLAKATCLGHDVIIVPDLHDEVRLTDKEVATVCDRHAGIGATSIVRVLRANADSGAEYRCEEQTAPGHVPSTLSLRAAAHYLSISGLADIVPGQPYLLATPAGEVAVTKTGGGYAMSEVAPALVNPAEASERGYDTAVSIGEVEGTRGGLTVTGEGDHVVVALATPDELAAARPEVTATDPVRSAQVVLVEPRGEDVFTDIDGVERAVSTCAVRMTYLTTPGLTAAALAMLAWAGEGGSQIARIDTGWGTGEVRLYETDAEVTAPAEVVAEFQLTGIAGEG